eukprot:g1242.t1
MLVQLSSFSALFVCLTTSLLLTCEASNIFRKFSKDVEGSETPTNWPELLPSYTGVAPDAAQVMGKDGKTRFTVLTSRMIRMEYSPNGKFEDRASLAFINRDVSIFGDKAVPKFSHSSDGKTLQIITDDVTLTYQEEQTFNSESLQVESSSKLTNWKYGDANTGNLLGTIRTLDQQGPTSLNCSVNKQTEANMYLHCEWGLISRDGWVIVDDTSNQVINPTTGWWEDREAIEGYQDLIGFFHGHDYEGALADFVQFGGLVALPPRNAAGSWWTRWYNMNGRQSRDIVNHYKSLSIPLDIFVYDMNWHTKNAWGGYTWDRRLFPFPEDMLGWLHHEGLAVAANIHDDTGVNTWEDTYSEFAKFMGDDSVADGANYPFSICNSSKYAEALEDIVLKNTSLDFWWIDWQQGDNHGGCKGGKQNPTIWLNKIRSTDAIRRARSGGSNLNNPSSHTNPKSARKLFDSVSEEKSTGSKLPNKNNNPSNNNAIQRDMVLGRFGGLGNHRYQVGFSGDVKGLTWENLAYQPYFSMTAANVAHGFWSHDLEGPRDDPPEMYVRWLQWGSFSGIFRAHERGMSAGGCNGNFPKNSTNQECSLVQMWDADSVHFQAIRSAMLQRARLVPYLYTSWETSHRSGLSPLRPMYYADPEEDMAYAAAPTGEFTQYYFGSYDMFVSPVVSPANASFDNLASKDIWIPSNGNSKWIEVSSGESFSSSDDDDDELENDSDKPENDSSVITRKFALHQVPIYVRAGAVIYERTIQLGETSTIATAAQAYDDLTFTLYPTSGVHNGSTMVYEDDGTTLGYLDGISMNHELTYALTTTVAADGTEDESTETMNIKLQTTGDQGYMTKEAQDLRTSRFKIVNRGPIVSINAANVDITSSPYCGTKGLTNCWKYIGNEAAIEVIMEWQLLKGVDLSMTYLVSDLEGIRGKIERANLCKEVLDELRVTPGAHDTNAAPLTDMSSLGDKLSHEALLSDNFDSWQQTVAGVNDLWNSALQSVDSIDPNSLGNGGDIRKAYCTSLLQA